jgi:hypothetical protein
MTEPCNAPDPPTLPLSLVEELGQILADALVADVRHFPNLASLQNSEVPTGSSPPGYARSRHRRPPKDGSVDPSVAHRGRGRRLVPSQCR